MARNSGWIKLNRSIFDNFLWKSQKPFDYRSAWVDLILLANHEDGQLVTSRGEVIKIPRGAHFTSTRSLADRWHWNRATVSRYLETLSDAGMVTLTVTHSGTLLSLVKYEDFQGGRATDYTADYTADHTTDYARTRKEEEDKKRRSSNRPASLQEKIEAMKRFIAEDKENDQGRGTEAL